MQRIVIDVRGLAVMARPSVTIEVEGYANREKAAHLIGVAAEAARDLVMAVRPVANDNGAARPAMRVVES